MKKLLFLTTLFFSTICFGQMEDECTDNFAAIHVGYAFPESIVLGADYYTGKGLVGGIGTAYTFPKTVEVKSGEISYLMQTNSFDIYAYLGWRLYRKDYVVSIFGNVGYTMGDVNGFEPFTSLKFLFPIGYKAISLEPVYIHGRGFAGKLSIHFKL
jgi:hypothetical protein